MQDQLVHCTNMYVDEILQQQFGALIAFVKHAESAQAAAQIPPDQPIPRFGSEEARPIAKDFTSKWSAAIETLNRCVKAFRTEYVVYQALVQHTPAAHLYICH